MRNQTDGMPAWHKTFPTCCLCVRLLGVAETGKILSLTCKSPVKLLSCPSCHHQLGPSLTSTHSHTHSLPPPSVTHSHSRTLTHALTPTDNSRASHSSQSTSFEKYLLRFIYFLRVSSSLSLSESPDPPRRQWSLRSNLRGKIDSCMGNSHAGPQPEQAQMPSQQPQKNNNARPPSSPADAVLENEASSTASSGGEIVTTAVVRVQKFVRRALSKREAESPPALPPPRLERAMTEELVDAFFSDKANTPLRSTTGRKAAGTPNAFAEDDGDGDGDGGGGGTATQQVDLSSILQAHSDSLKMASEMGATTSSSSAARHHHSSAGEEDSSGERTDGTALSNPGTSTQSELAETDLTSLESPPRFTQKRRYLQHLKHLIGPAPARRTWRDEFPRALAHADWLADV